MKSLALFNNKGGVGKTTLTFHIAHMAARQGLRVAVLDYDPQCNLSSFFFEEDELFALWEDNGAADQTVSGCIDAVRRGKGEVRKPRLRQVADQLWVLPGQLELSRFEQELAKAWSGVMAADNERALDVTTSLDLLSNLAADSVAADLVLVDVGPSLGALNRAALLCCDAIVIPLAPDLFSLQGMRNVGPTLREWQQDWGAVRERHLQGRDQARLPPHDMRPIGYIVQQHLARKDQAVKGYAKWAELIPSTYSREVLGSKSETHSVEDDPSCLRMIRHFASLVPIAQQARKPMFDLKQSDGIGGGQIQAVARCRAEFVALVQTLLERLGLAPAGLDRAKPS